MSGYTASLGALVIGLTLSVHANANTVTTHTTPAEPSGTVQLAIDAQTSTLQTAGIASAALILARSDAGARIKHYRSQNRGYRKPGRAHKSVRRAHHKRAHVGKSHRRGYSTHKAYRYQQAPRSYRRYYRHPYAGRTHYGHRYYYSGHPYSYYGTPYRYRLSPYGIHSSPYYYRQRNFYNPGYLGLTLPFERYHRGHVDATAWVWSAHGKRPHGAIVGGRIHGQRYYICQANYKNGRYTGKLYRKGCHINANGRQVVLKRYKVLVER